MSCFRDELTALLNRYSMESGSDTPDFILADFLLDALRAFDTATANRESWCRPDERRKAKEEGR